MCDLAMLIAAGRITTMSQSAHFFAAAAYVAMLLSARGAQTKPAADPVPQLEQALAKNPDDPKVNVALGVAYLDRGDPARALEKLRHAVKVAPDSAEAHNWLGVVLSTGLISPGDSRAAEGDRARPDYGRAYANLGSALAKSGDLDEAVEVFRKALALEPNNTGAHFNLGMALREKGDLDAALHHLRRVVEAEPGNASMHYELGQTLRQSGDLGGAIAEFERRSRSIPSCARATTRSAPR